MLKRPDPVRLRQLRARVLQLAYLAAMSEASNPDDPYTLSRNVLVGTLEQADELPSGEDLRAAVRYLETKGTIEVRWLRDGTGEFASFRLRAYGIDLVEGSAVDNGITFSRRRDG